MHCPGSVEKKVKSSCYQSPVGCFGGGRGGAGGGGWGMGVFTVEGGALPRQCEKKVQRFFY